MLHASIKDSLLDQSKQLAINALSTGGKLFIVGGLRHYMDERLYDHPRVEIFENRDNGDELPEIPANTKVVILTKWARTTRILKHLKATANKRNIHCLNLPLSDSDLLAILEAAAPKPPEPKPLSKAFRPVSAWVEQHVNLDAPNILAEARRLFEMSGCPTESLNSLSTIIRVLRIQKRYVPTVPPEPPEPEIVVTPCAVALPLPPLPIVDPVELLKLLDEAISASTLAREAIAKAFLPSVECPNL